MKVLSFVAFILFAHRLFKFFYYFKYILVPGIVTRSKVFERVDGVLEFVYVYEYEGISYTSDRIFSLYPQVSPVEKTQIGILRKHAKRWPEGALVQVFINPQRPEDAFLVNGPLSQAWIFLLISLLAIIFDVMDLLFNEE